MLMNAGPGERAVDCTPIGWTPSTSFDDMFDVQLVLKELFEKDWTGIWMHAGGVGVWLIDRDGLLVAERRRNAKIRIGAIRQQQILMALHESGNYERARARMLQTIKSWEEPSK